jgi:hypothetical protein
LVLKARHEIVGETIEIRLTSTPLLNYFTEPLVQQSGRNTARAALGTGLAVSAFPLYVPV